MLGSKKQLVQRKQMVQTSLDTADCMGFFAGSKTALGDCAGQTGMCGANIPEMARVRWHRKAERNRSSSCGAGRDDA